MKFFNLFKASIKLGARKISDNSYNRDVAISREKAYKKTGKQIRFARRSGRFIDGSKAYNTNLANSMILPNQRKARRDKFIDEI